MAAGIAVENPATGAVIRTVPSLDAEEVRSRGVSFDSLRR